MLLLYFSRSLSKYFLWLRILSCMSFFVFANSWNLSIIKSFVWFFLLMFSSWKAYYCYSLSVLTILNYLICWSWSYLIFCNYSAFRLSLSIFLSIRSSCIFNLNILDCMLYMFLVDCIFSCFALCSPISIVALFS